MQSLKKPWRKSDAPQQRQASEGTPNTTSRRAESGDRRWSLFFWEPKKKQQQQQQQQQQKQPEPVERPELPKVPIEAKAPIGILQSKAASEPPEPMNGKSKRRLQSKLRAKTNSRSSAESSRSSTSLKGLPFPLLRSHSSQSASRSTRGGRSGSIGQSFLPSPESTAARRRRTYEKPPDIPVVVVDETEEPIPVRTQGQSAEEYVQQLHKVVLTTSLRWRQVAAQLAGDLAHYPDCIEILTAFLSPSFVFSGEPVDMSLRKFLFCIHLPLESQQIDRILRAFSVMYDNMNPGVFDDVDQVNWIVCSLLMLHTSAFNRNVRQKLPKADYVLSAQDEGIPPELAEYLYENITCLEFPRFVESPATSPSMQATPLPDPPTMTSIGDGDSSRRSTMSLPWAGTSNNLQTEIYPILLSGRLDLLRSHIEAPSCPPPDNFIPTFGSGPESLAQFSVIRDQLNGGGQHWLQLLSPRSRPDAYLNQFVENGDDMSAENLIQQTRPGVVEVRVVKHGILLRHEPKRPIYSTNRRTPGWREWGAVLTESQLYLFKNPSWVKTIVESSGQPQGQVTRAPVEALGAAISFSTTDLAALPILDTVGEHKLQILTRGSSPTIMAVPDPKDLTEWLRLINVTATYATFRIPLPPATPTLARSSSETSLRSLGSMMSRSSLASGTSPPPIPAQPTVQRTYQLAHQLREVDRQLAGVQTQIEEHCRVIRHFKILAPIQQRTREAIVFATGQYASKIDASCLERSRLRVYREIMGLDLQIEQQQQQQNSRARRARGFASLTPNSSRSSLGQFQS